MATVRARGARLLLLGLGLLMGGGASAEIYKCRGPDGRTIFTSDASQCPGAQAHEPKGNVQRSLAPRPAAPRRTRPVQPAAADAAGEASWRAKKARAEHRLAVLERRVEYLRQATTYCNRGGEFYVEDDTGIRRSHSCDEVREEWQSLKDEQTGLRSYLAEGLEEECRRSGCLPGWIR